MDDFPRLPKRPERLFYCIFPDSEGRERLAQFAKRFIVEQQLEGSQIKPERLHISLQHVGDFKRLWSRYIYAAQLAGNLVAIRPFEMTFGFIRTLGRSQSEDPRQRRPLVLVGQGEALFDLHHRLGTAMEKYGLRAGSHFMPHMTLQYGPGEISQQPIEPIRCVVHGFALIHSELWRTRYHRLAAWPQ